VTRKKSFFFTKEEVAKRLYSQVKRKRNAAKATQKKTKPQKKDPRKSFPSEQKESAKKSLIEGLYAGNSEGGKKERDSLP